jgi:2-polyprenyl-3-methyl-5-hydroxy-6-metoxy-1,4-benzoquinol methylase
MDDFLDRSLMCISRKLPNSEQIHKNQKVYPGIRILEILEDAKNYNCYLISLIEKIRKPYFSLLDFGSGVGTFALPLSRQGVDIICIEPDDELRGRLQKSGVTVVTKLSSIRNESLDMIYTFNVLEHIPDDGATLQELANKLKPSGILLIYVPAFMVLYSSFDRDIGHLRRYRRRSLINLVNATGLRVIDAHYVDCIGFGVVLLLRALGLEKDILSQRKVKFYDRVLFPLSRICDIFFHHLVGKNIVLISVKDPTPSPGLYEPCATQQ